MKDVIGMLTGFFLVLTGFTLILSATDMTMEFKFQKKQPAQEQEINPCQQ